MIILLLLIPLSVMLLSIAIVAFAWAVRGGQFDELEVAALDILVDVEPALAVAQKASSEPFDAD